MSSMGIKPRDSIKVGKGYTSVQIEWVYELSFQNWQSTFYTRLLLDKVEEQ